MYKSAIFLIIVLLCLSSYTHSDSRSMVDDTIDGMSLSQQLEDERKYTIQLEEEIDYYRQIAQQKVLVQKLYTNGKITEIENLVLKKSKQIDRKLEDNLISSFNAEVNELRVIYSEVPEVKDYVLYYNGKKKVINQEEKLALPLLEELLGKYPQSSKKDEGLLLLEEIYFKLGEDEKFADIYDKYTEINTLEQNFWIAHTYFNLGRYEQSRSIFNILKKSSGYGFESESMLALIKSFTEGSAEAIDAFLILKDTFSQEIENYDFILISLARLYALNEDIELATKYYLSYYDMQIYEISDAILFEMASVFGDYGDYKQSMTFLNMIVERPRKSEYFVSAKYLKAISQQGLGDAEKAESTITDMIEQNNMLLEMLNSKYKLLKKYHTTNIELMNTSITKPRKVQLENQIVSIENSLEKTNNTLEDLYTGLNPTQLNMLKMLEQEYFLYSSTLTYMQVLIKLANTVPNKKIPRLLDMEIARIDSSRKSLEIIKYLGHLESVTDEDYAFAKIIIEEKEFHNDLINIWNEIGEIARVNDHEEILPYVTSSKTILYENINSLDVIANHLYSGNIDEDFKLLIEEEIVAVESNKIQLKTLKEIVVKNFNKKIAKNLSTERELLTAEFEDLNLLYDNALSDVIGSIQNENDQYRLNVLGVLFRQTQIKDSEYKELQEKVKNE